MFGMDVPEIMILLIVGIVVVGPKRLPEMMRKAGQYVTKLRRLSSDLRSQSGIDRILREEGLEKEIRELRSLRESLSKHALFDSLVAAANKPAGSTGKSTSGGPAVKTLPKNAGTANALGPASTTTASEDSTTTDEAATEGTVALASDGTATTSQATNLIRPAAGAVARGPLPPANRTPYRSFREREYPSYGPDHYDALPDDLEDNEEEAAAQAAAEAAAEAGVGKAEPANGAPLPDDASSAEPAPAQPAVPAAEPAVLQPAPEARPVASTPEIEKAAS